MRIFIFILIILPKIILSQEVRGVIMYKSEPLPFANIYVSGTSNGTFANSQGEFALIVNSLEDTLVIFSNGFKEKSIIAKTLKKNPLVKLSKKEYKLELVTVSNKKRFARSIIKNVIKNSSKNNYFNASFSTNLYTKSILDKKDLSKGRFNDTLQLSFSEKYSKISYHEGKFKEIKLGVQDLSTKEEANLLHSKKWDIFNSRKLIETNIKSDLFYTDISDGNFNFYKGLISVPKLGQNPFISPLGPLSLISYDFSYLGSYIERGNVIHKIKIIPKRPHESVFNGIVQIEDSSWSIVTVQLEMNGKNLHKYESFKIFQRFNQQNGKRILDRQEFFFHYTSGYPTKSYHGSVYSKFSNYDFSSKKIKIGNLTQVTPFTAFNKSSTFWEDKRSIQLNKKEMKFIAASSKLKQIKKSEKYIKIKDSLRNRTTFWEFTFSGMDHYNTPKGYKWKFDPLIQQARIFGIGGYRHALGGLYIKKFKNKNDLFIKTTINYGFNNNDLLSDASIKYTYAPRRFAQIKISGGSKYEMLTFMQNLSSLLSRGNFTRNNFLKLGHFTEVLNGLFLDIDLKYTQRFSISKLSLSKWSEDFFSNKNQPIEFENYNEFNLKFLLSYTPYQKFGFEGKQKIIKGSKWPTLYTIWEQGLPDILRSKINYKKVTVGLNQSLKIGLLGTTKSEVMYGQYISIKSIELPNYTFFRGTDNYLFSHPLYTFQLLGETHKSIKNYLSINLIHHFHGAITKKIPFIKKTKIEAVTGGGVLYINDNNLKHLEIYNGLEIPFKLGETQLKFGGYYAIASSNYSDLLNMLKFGINIFNPFTNKWAF